MPLNLRALGLIGCAALLPSVVHAQEAEGLVAGVVFARGTGIPLAGVEVRVAGVRTATDARGRFILSVPAGDHAVEIDVDGEIGRTIAARVVPGGRTEVLVTWAPEEPWLPAQIEAPPSAGMGQEEVLEGPAGTVSGQVVSAEDGSPVPGARVYVRGRTAEAIADGDGRFNLELPAGSWELSVIASAFAAQGVDDVQVVAEETTDLRVELVPAGLALDDFMVRAPRITGGTASLLDERRTSSAVADLIGAEQMARTGDSSAAGALRRVTGLTLVGGRFIYVRGMGERYSSTLLNGGQLPSPEPERRVVPLDLFPASILDSVVVQKTFSPDMPAEFGGGTVQLRTKSFPTGPVVQAIVSGSGRGGTTFAPGLDYPGGKGDYWGVDGGTRALPEDVAAASEDSPLKEGDRFSELGYTPEELQSFGRALPNVWTPTPIGSVPPDLGFQLSLGNGFEVGGRPVGALAAFNFANNWRTDRFTRTYYQLSGEEVVPATEYDFVQTSYEARMSGMLALGAEPAEGQRIESTTLVLRSTEDEARTFEGIFEEEATDIRVNRLRWVERMLIAQQLRGTHDLATGVRPAQFRWRYAFAKAFRFEPDRRQTRYDYSASLDQFSLSRRDGDSNARFFSELDDRTHDAALDFTVPIRLRDDADVKLKAGTWFVRKDREVDSRRFTFLAKGTFEPDFLAEDPETVFAEENISPDGFQLKEVTQATDNYIATQTLVAGYLMAEIPVMPWLDVMAGARVESSRQEVTTFELFNPNGTPIVAELSNVDVLPAATFTFRPRDDMTVRLGYGRTVSRPEFRELSPAIFQDVVGGRPNVGNEELRRATIENADVRWEWFPEKRDVVSVSGFFKYLSRPIEVLVLIGADEFLTYENAESATNLGLELEARKGMGFAHPALEDLYVAFNASLIRSRIQLGADNAGVQTNDVRPLQGQSPWVINAQLGWDDPELGLNAALLYNVFGPRISEVGSFGLPDSYEEPFHALDLVVNAKLPKGFDLRFTARNMLDQRNVFRLGPDLIESRRPGWSLGLRLGWQL